MSKKEKKPATRTKYVRRLVTFTLNFREFLYTQLIKTSYMMLYIFTKVFKRKIRIKH